VTVRRVLLLLILVGGGARIFWVAHAGIAPQFTSDPEAYLLQGEAIAKGEGYTNPLIDIANAQRRRDHQPEYARQPTSFYPPGYPAFIAVVAWTVWHTPIPDGDLVRAIEYVQAVIGAFSILLAFLLARRVFDVTTGVIAAAIVAFYPNLVTMTATLQLETVFVALSLLAVLVLVPAATGEDTRAVRLVAGGALTGAVALVRPTIALVVIALLATRFLMRCPWRKIVRDVALVTIAMVAVIVPWTIRNAVALHAFVPVSTGIGPALCMSRNAEATGGLDTVILYRQCSPHGEKFAPGAGDAESNTYATRRAIHWVVAHPLEEVKFWWWRTNLAYRHDTSGIDQYERLMSHHARHIADAVSDDASFIVLGLAFVGAVVVVTGRRPPRGVFLLATTLAFAAVPAMLFGDPRYRVPAEPFFAILAAVPLAYAAAAFTRRRAAA
jgi:4-amino-4-deoxy-L-arabinose transferase-like glycosyltransferase